MMRSMVKTLLLVAFIIGMTGAVNTSVAAADPFKQIFEPGEKLVDKTAVRGQQVIYGIGGLGTIAVGALAFFGRFTWGRLFAIIGSVAMIAGAQMGIEYITGQSKVFSQTKNSN